MKIYILCGNAAYNRGDRGNLYSQISLLKEKYPAADIVFDSFRPEIDKNWYGARVVQRGWLLSFQQIKEISNSDIVVWGGGALIADNAFKLIIPMWLMIIAFTKLILGKPVMAWSHGVILETSFGSVLANIVYKLVSVITVRDVDSYNALINCKIDSSKIIKTADPAILLNISNPESGRTIISSLGLSKTFVVIAPTFWPFHHRKNDFIPYMVKAKYCTQAVQQDELSFCQSIISTINYITEKTDREVILIPHYPARPWRDLDNLKTIKSKCQQSKLVHVLETDDYAPNDFASIYHCADLVIAGSLHDAVFANSLNKPVIQINYENKCNQFAAAINTSNWTIEIDRLIDADGSKELQQMIDRIATEWPGRQAEILLNVNKYKKLAYENINILDRFILNERIAD